MPCKLGFTISTGELCKKTEKIVCDVHYLTFSMDSSTSKVHIPESDEGQPPVVNKSELCPVSTVEHTCSTTDVFEQDNKVTTEI